MCTKEEVRQVIKEVVMPAWTRHLLSLTGVCMLGLLSWLVASVHNQDAILERALNNIKNSQMVGVAKLTGRIELLTVELKNIKEVAINRSVDRYTGTQARAREKFIDSRNKASDILENERYKVISDKVKRNKYLIEKHHKIN